MEKRNVPILSFIFLLLFLMGTTLSCDEQPEHSRPALQSKTDSPPVISSITILPARPTKESELSLCIQSHNPDGYPVTCRYQWIKNDEEIPGENARTLKCESLKKGDLIRVKVIPSDGKRDGKPFLSDPIKILNMPPVVEEAYIEPKLAYVNSELRAVVKVSNPDGDSIHYLYRWEKNGIALSGQDTAVLQPDQLKKGDSVAVTVTPADGESSGRGKKSEARIIANSPPLIISSPPNNLSGNIYTYRVKAEDPDNDPIIFALKTAPKEMKIDKETGLIQWELSTADQGDHPIEIEATDPEGAKSLQRYTLTIEFR